MLKAVSSDSTYPEGKNYGKVQRSFSYKKTFRFFMIAVSVCVLVITSISAFSFVQVFKLSEAAQSELFMTQQQIDMVKMLPDYLREAIFIDQTTYDYFDEHLQACKEQMQFCKEKYHNYEKTIYWAYTDCLNILESLGDNALSIWNRYQTEKNYSAASTLILNDIERMDGYVLAKLQEVAGEQVLSLQVLSDQILRSLVHLQIIIVICSVIFGLIYMLLGRYLSYWLLNPLQLLTQRVENNMGEHIEIPAQSPTEIEMLTSKYNDFIDKSNEALERAKAQAQLENDLKQERIINLELKNEIIKSQINFLQSQINPHFLFNALSTVSYVAGIERAHETNELVLNITSLLRYTFKNVGKNVAIYEELDYVRNYLNICSFRHGDTFTSTISASPDVIHLEIPALTIQPFVENVFRHGLNKRSEKETFIWIAVKRADQKIVILIKDNGCGMSEEQVELLNSDSYGDSHGIQNVRRRLLLLYGSASVKISSKEGKGTEVSIEIPIKDDSV